MTASRLDPIKRRVIERCGAVFNSALHAGSATIEAVMDRIDGPGKEFEDVIYTTTMQRLIANRIN